MDKAAFLHVDETAAQLLIRCAATPLETGIFFIDSHTRLRAKHVALLSGGDGIAKSCILVQVAAHCILPAQAQGYEIGGLEGTCILMDLDLKFDIVCLVNTLTVRLRSALHDLNEDQFGRASTELLGDCLARFALVRCHSSFEYLAALKALPTQLSRIVGDAPLKFLLIDGCTATGKLESKTEGVSGLSAAQVLTLAAGHLQAFLPYRVAVIATQNIAAGTAADTPEGLHHSLLPPGWQPLVTHHILLSTIHSESSVNQHQAAFQAQFLLPHKGATSGFRVNVQQLSPILYEEQQTVLGA